MPQISSLTGKTPLERLEQSLQTANTQFAQNKELEMGLTQQMNQRAKQRKEEQFVQAGVGNLLEQAMTPDEEGKMMDEATLRSNVFKTGLRLMLGGGKTGQEVVPILDKMLTGAFPKPESYNLEKLYEQGKLGKTPEENQQNYITMRHGIPKPTNSKDEELGYVKLPNGRWGMQYGVKGTNGQPNVVRETKELASDKDGKLGNYGSKAERQKDIKMLQKLSQENVDLGIEMRKINQGIYKDEKGNKISARKKDAEGNIIDDPRGKELLKDHQAKIEANIKEINQLQRMLDFQEAGGEPKVTSDVNVLDTEAQKAAEKEKAAGSATQPQQVKPSQKSLDYFNQNKNNPEVQKQFKERYGFLPS